MRPDEDVTELCETVFADLSRSDQRRRGSEYIQGLLSTHGRKSIRNIAAISDDHAAEQALHHFVSDSTWHWMPVRRALTRHVTGFAKVAAWVLHPTLIRKAGTHSVGVGRKFSSIMHRSLNAQHAVGLWAATTELVAPVNWRLHLNGDWLTDERRRQRAAIPDDVVAQPLDACAVDTYLELDVARDAVVLIDARDMDAETVVRRLRASGAPVLARIPDSLRLVAATGSQPEPPGDLLAAGRHNRRPLLGIRGNTPVLVNTVLTRLPGTRTPDPLMLLGLGAPGRSGPDELWLASHTDAGLVDLIRVTSLFGRVARELESTGDRVGLRDFTGRSYGGWHRHATLASAAHILLATRERAKPTLSRVC